MDSFPNEIIEKILSFHTAKDIETYKLVSRKFYDAASRVLSFKKPLKITFAKLIDNTIYDSMLDTSRRFNVVELNTADFNEDAFTKLVELLTKIGTTVTAIKIRPNSTSLKISILIEIFAALKNLKSIKIQLKYRIRLDMPLPSLDSLELSHAAKGAIEIASRLSFLPVLELTPDDLPSSWTLQSVDFDENFPVDASFFRNIKIKKLTYINKSEEFNSFMSQILATQNHIEELVESDLHLNEKFGCKSNLLRNICNMTSLKKLCLKIHDDVAPGELRALGNLINLEELRIIMGVEGDDCFINLANVHFPSLKVLYFKGSWPYVDELMTLRQLLSANWPKLQEIEGSLHGVLVEVDLNIFLDSLPELTTLIMCYLSLNDFQLHGHYPAFRKLELSNGYLKYGEQFVLTPEFFNALPNLTEMDVSSMSFIVSIDTMQAILDSRIQKLYFDIMVQRDERSDIEQLIERIKEKTEAKIKIKTIVEPQ